MHFRLKLQDQRHLYFLIVITIVVLIAVTQLISHTILNAQRKGADVINLAGRQRVLSHKTARLSVLMKEDASYLPIWLQEIEETDGLWSSVYSDLQKNSYLNLPADKKDSIEGLFRQIQPFKDSITSTATTLALSSSPGGRDAQIEIIRRNEARFLPLMDTLVSTFEQQIQEKVNNLHTIGLGWTVLSIIIILVEFLFIFKPAFTDLTQKNEELKKAYKEQEILNRELAQTEKKLRYSLDHQVKISESLEAAKKKAEQASIAKAQFLSNMSHEIRTPMSAVIGLVHLLLEGNPKNSQKENLQALKFSSESMLALINDILDFSKIEAGKVEFEKSEFNLEDLFKGITHSLGVKAAEKDIYLKCSLAPDIPKNIVGDPIRLAQILNNLLSNAIKFTLNGGVTMIAEVADKTNNEVTIHFSVTDTGIGIPENKLRNIFETFSQADKDIARRFGGTGLGLAITKKLLEFQQSDIHVKSEVDKGTVFSFKLKFACRGEGQAGKSHVQQKRSKAGSLKGVKILVAEDNKMNGIVIRQFLEKWGVEFAIVENGKKALDQLAKYSYDLILMDIQMPEMDGYEAARAIRETNLQIPIIALTASAVFEVQQKTSEAGMNDCVTKPFVPDDLFEKIKKQLPRKAHI